MNKLREQESSEGKAKGIALKTFDKREENNEEGSNDCSDAKTLNMLTKMFNRFLKKK